MAEADGRSSNFCDFVNVLVVNGQGDALIFEHTIAGSSIINWRLVSEMIAEDADPLTAVQQALYRQAGLHCDEWRYLGSYTSGSYLPAQAGHFFFARCVQQKAPSVTAGRARWVSLKDLRYALLDGRISTISHAMTVSIALLTMVL